MPSLVPIGLVVSVEKSCKIANNNRSGQQTPSDGSSSQGQVSLKKGRLQDQGKL